MKSVDIFSVARRYPAWVWTAEEYYRRQIRCFTLNDCIIKPSTTPDKEAEAVLASLPKGAYCILLDSGGQSMTSTQFAQAMTTWYAENQSTVFVIGGADGAGERLRQAAHSVLSLSPLTFPHALARLILVEQLFRADCVMRRHPYPR